ncbi:MAG: L,D-transpeptidase family protein [Rhizobiaceae bacterium]|nr:L,D-transpeptidase family protein [Rhizobiaceae bacterium]
MPCVLGSGGVRARKKEGDGATPVGSFEILYGFYRADRIKSISSAINLMPIKENFGWCDDPLSPLYNRFVELPSSWNHEKMWRKDNLYDICLVLNHNIHPQIRNGGSAIFFHLCSHDNTPTQGCIAITQSRMTKILGRCSARTRLIIYP